MRLLLIISNLQLGGAERLLAHMANYWSSRGHDVTLLTLAEIGTDLYKVNPGVRRIGLGLRAPSASSVEAVKRNIQRVLAIRRVVRAAKPNVVISFLDIVNVLTLMATIGIRIPVIVSERTEPRQHVIGRVWQGLRNLFYGQAKAIVVQTESVGQWARDIARRCPVAVIPNFVDIPSDPVIPKSDARAQGFQIVGMGRLRHEKGFDLLIEAFARCARRNKDWTLSILGDGDEGPKLESQATSLGIRERVHFLGLVVDPFPLLRTADLFVLPSRYEGFPNALLEAMAVGVPVIATDCPSGPRDIVRSGYDGLLVSPENVDALEIAMERLMKNPEERRRLSRRAPEVHARFSKESIMREWDAVISEGMRVATS